MVPPIRGAATYTRSGALTTPVVEKVGPSVNFPYRANIAGPVRPWCGVAPSSVVLGSAGVAMHRIRFETGQNVTLIAASGSVRSTSLDLDSVGTAGSIPSTTGVRPSVGVNPLGELP